MKLALKNVYRTTLFATLLTGWAAAAQGSQSTVPRPVGG
jgi:hypothetical protein